MGGGLLGCRKGGEGLIITPSVFDASTKEASFEGSGDGTEEGERVRGVLFPLVFEWERKEGGNEAAPFALPLDVCIETITSLLDRLLLASATPLLVEKTGEQDGERGGKEGGKEVEKAVELSPNAFLTPEMLLRKHKEAAWEVVVACVAALVVKDDDGAERGQGGGKEEGGGVPRHRNDFSDHYLFSKSDHTAPASSPSSSVTPLEPPHDQAKKRKSVHDRFTDLLNSTVPPPPPSRPSSLSSTPASPPSVSSMGEGGKEGGKEEGKEEADSSLLFTTLKNRRCLERGNDLLRKLWVVVVEACADVHLGAKARVFARGLGLHFLLVMATHTETIARGEGGGMEVEGAVPETEEVRVFGGDGGEKGEHKDYFQQLNSPSFVLSLLPSLQA